MTNQPKEQVLREEFRNWHHHNHHNLGLPISPDQIADFWLSKLFTTRREVLEAVREGLEKLPHKEMGEGDLLEKEDVLSLLSPNK